MNNSSAALNDIYNEFKIHFMNSGFHSVLWQIMINKAVSDSAVAFNPVVGESTSLMLALADQNGGYRPTMAYFNSNIPYDKATEICAQLNEKVFGLLPSASQRIIESSFTKKP